MALLLDLPVIAFFVSFILRDMWVMKVNRNRVERAGLNFKEP